MSISFTNESIMNGLNSMFNKKLKEILLNISQKYSIDEGQLLDSYLDNNINTNETSSVASKKKKIKKTNTIDLCVARKADGRQCSRKKKNTNEYCGKHSSNLKYGRMDDTEDSNGVKYAENDKYIMTWHENIDGVDYLVDSNNIVYSYHMENPVILGKKNTKGEIMLAPPYGSPLINENVL